MSTPADGAEKRKLRSIARQYERDGYRVTVPEPGGHLPAFLRGFTPDLIAESELDHVVIELKRSDAVPGSNELRELAERVSGEPGWRFELVTLPPVERVVVPTAERMEAIEDRTRQVMSAGLNDVAYAYAWTAVEEVLKDLALQHGLGATKVPFGQAVRELVFRGIIPHKTLDTVEQARAVRTRLVHAEQAALPSDADVEGLLALGRRLRGEMAVATMG